MELVKPKAHAVKDELHKAIAEAASMDLSQEALPYLVSVRDRLKNTVASAKVLYYPKVDTQALSQPDDASRAIHAIRKAIAVAECACSSFQEASLLINEACAFQGSAWSKLRSLVAEVVDLDESDADTSPFNEITHLQEIRRLLAKVQSCQRIPSFCGSSAAGRVAPSQNPQRDSRLERPS